MRGEVVLGVVEELAAEAVEVDAAGGGEELVAVIDAPAVHEGCAVGLVSLELNDCEAELVEGVEIALGCEEVW